MNRVAVTGLGLVCALGNSVEECWPKLARGESGIGPLLDPGVPPLRFPNGAFVRDFDADRHFESKEQTFLDRFAQLGAVAAREAVQQSGISYKGEFGERAAVITGSSVGGQAAEEDAYYRLYNQGATRVPPLTIPKAMNNAVSSRISFEFGIRGPAYTISTACSSSNHAVGQAFHLIRSGMVKSAVAGGSETVFSKTLLRAWEAMRVVSTDTCRPFSLNRKGLILGEGAAMLVLEDWEHATARGAKILAEFVGFGMSSDAHHITQPASDGAARAMRWALEDAQVRPEQVQYINAHGTGTAVNDSTETEAIRLTYTTHADNLLVSSTKSMHGHALGAAGAIEAVVTACVLQHGIVPPTANYTEPDPACNLNVVPNNPQKADVEYAMSNSFAFGGLNAAIVMRRV